MNNRALIRFVAAPLGALLLITACASGGGAGWTYAPLGPTASPATPTTAPTSGPTGGPTGSPGASPSPDGSPGPGLTIDVTTTDADPLAFDPEVIEAPPATEITVNYLNDNTLPHNIHFFAGPDANAPSLALTEVVEGPGALESVTFTTPAEAGDYYFWCDVHVSSMDGTLRILAQE
ncbi:MAG TPA: plastocyanin/azurin family copper-binding protein [Egibacteraceae bacterium]|nr:plastocyanin/azurin family copper-binding protein [Egibacteraceae bacterium]